VGQGEEEEKEKACILIERRQVLENSANSNNNICSAFGSRN
jgi:hypothetical protein